MFGQLDAFTKSLIVKVSSHEIFSASEDEHKYPLLKQALRQNCVWMDLCHLHFNLKPFSSERAKIFFQGEYLYANNKLEQAAEKGSFNAFVKLINQMIKKGAYPRAMCFAEAAIDIYGIVGYMLSLQIYQSLCFDGVKKRDKEACIANALSALNKIEELQPDERSTYYLEMFGWYQKINEIYGGLADYLEMGRNYFTK